MKDKDLKALGLVGLGLLGLSAWSRSEIRSRFQEKLSTTLQELGFDVESTSFGRGPDMIGIWTVSLVTKTGPKRERIQIPAKLEPYSEEAFETILTHFRGSTNEATG
jgi:hypothetical protein